MPGLLAHRLRLCCALLALVLVSVITSQHFKGGRYSVNLTASDSGSVASVTLSASTNSPAYVDIGSVLGTNQVLTTDEFLKSPTGGYYLIMQGDGNLVEYNAGNQPLWASGTVNHPGDYLIMQGDGNLVIYASNKQPLWASGTGGAPGTGFHLVIQSDANVVVYSSTQALWSRMTGKVATGVPGAIVRNITISTPACGSIEFPSASTGSWVIPGGGVPIYSNGLLYEGSGTSCAKGQSQVGSQFAGYKWQCSELVNRLYLARGWLRSTWYGNAGAQMWQYAPAQLIKRKQGSIPYLGPGDAVIINVYYKGAPEGGHALVVNDSSEIRNGTVALVSQNSGWKTQSEPVVQGTIQAGAVTVGGGGSGWAYQVIGVVYPPGQ